MTLSSNRQKKTKQLLQELSGSADAIDAFLLKARAGASKKNVVPPDKIINELGDTLDGLQDNFSASVIPETIEKISEENVLVLGSEAVVEKNVDSMVVAPEEQLVEGVVGVAIENIDERFPPLSVPEPVIAKDTSFQASPAEDLGPVDEINFDILPIIAEELDELVPLVDEELRGFASGDRSQLQPLHRHVHTIKGSMAMAGAKRIRTLVHGMETWLAKEEAGQGDGEGVENLITLFENIKDRISILLGRKAEPIVLSETLSDNKSGSTTKLAPVAHTQRLVRVSAQDIDKLVADNNEARLAAAGMLGSAKLLRAMLMELQENGQRLSRVQRDLEIQAESQIQSRRAQLQEAGQEFDPLEMDRFTRLQEVSRSLAESVSDASDIYREITRQVATHESLLAEQEGAIQEVGVGLARTRLVPVDAINDRLYQVVWQTARELQKNVEFRLDASSGQGLDRALLDKLVAPLEHILRNAVAHGIETPERRKELNKPAMGTVVVSFRQEASRVVVDVSDDGAGLSSERIRQKAVERGLWPENKVMDEQAAADMICTPGFSTVDKVTQLAGRGVGMDVVRSDVLGMGGRFAIHNHEGEGLSIKMYLPLTVASVSAAAIEVAGEAFALPVETVEHTIRLAGEDLSLARASGKVVVELEGIPTTITYSDMAPWLGLEHARPPAVVNLLVLREGDHRIALGADRLLGIQDMPLRPLGSWWSGVAGIMGAVLLSNGRAAFLVDPLRMRSISSSSSRPVATSTQDPIVMIVDDSITVRKVAARFLEKNGFRPVLARDGREALELLLDIVPDAILMDVEMPRMDGFDCARNIRENPKLAGIPIAMVTSRTAEKHRRRAKGLGVQAYFGKPFREEDILSWLSSCLPQTP